MDRKGLALLAALTAVVTCAARPPEAPPAAAGAGAVLTRWILMLELGAPEQGQRLAELFFPEPTPEAPEEGEELEVLAPAASAPSPSPFRDEPSPEPAEDPGPAADPGPSAVPEISPVPPEVPAPTATPEIRSFTDGAETPMRNETSFSVDAGALFAEGPPQRLPAAGPQVLIMHTHGTEAYTPAPGETYEESDPYRTTDGSHSVVRVGDALASALEECGLRVIHDRSLYDYPSYAGSYERSGAAVERWLSAYPGIAVVIDVHRDAVGDRQVVYKTLASLSGESPAQVMLVVGTGENGLAHPLWRDNLRLALALQDAAQAASPGLVRPLRLVKERYNQQLTTGSLILEVGTNGNTLSEACRAAELFGRAAGPLLASLAED